MTVHGTARFATRGELEKAGLLCDWTPGVAPGGLLLGWWRESEYDFAPITYDGDLHQIIVGGTGGGKFTTAIAPLLLGSCLEDSTVVVVDPKGEIANLAGAFFQKAFAKEASVFVIDPWDVCGTGESARINVLDPIRLSNPNYVDDARALADAMIIPSGAENTHWDNAARNFLTGVILYVALHPDENQRDLMRVRDIITMTWAMPKAYLGPKRPTLSELMFKHLTSELAGGAVRRAFATLINREDKERSGILSSIERDTAWIDSPQMAGVLKGDSLDMKEAVTRGRKYFIVLPPDYFMTHRAWLRLMVTAFAKAMKRYRPDKERTGPERWRHIVIDEFATLGEMSFMLNDIAVARGFDMKYHFAVQDLAQLRREYRDGWESFINNSFQRFFAVGDLFTADYVSRMLGASTVESVSQSSSESRTIAESQGTSRSTSEGYSSPPGWLRPGTSTGGTSESITSGSSRSFTRGTGRSAGPARRALLTSDEVRRLGADEQVLFMRQMHPIRCWRPPYWEAFPSLPAYALKDVLGTIGRAPANEDEHILFEGWRSLPLLMQPRALPETPPTDVPGHEYGNVLSEPMSLRRKLLLGLGVYLLLLWWLWPSSAWWRDMQARLERETQRQTLLVDAATASKTQRAIDSERGRREQARQRALAEAQRAKDEILAKQKAEAEAKRQEAERTQREAAAAEAERMKDPAYRRAKELAKLDADRDAALRGARDVEVITLLPSRETQQLEAEKEEKARARPEDFAHLGFRITDGKGMLYGDLGNFNEKTDRACALRCLALNQCTLFSYGNSQCGLFSKASPADILVKPGWILGVRAGR
jgi:type IV secretory pathway TraG/TraD family ATPase VirD4